MNNRKKDLIISIVSILLCIIFTILVMVIDVEKIGPNGTLVGFSFLNGLVSKIIGVNMNWYKMTEIIGLFPIIIAFIYALLGLIQFIKRKSIFKVDREIFLLGIFYGIVIFIYVFFEKFIINYRPTLIEGKLEASYPSSHTMMSIFICISSIMVNKYLIKNIKLRKVLDLFLIILTLLIVVGRIISGVHWFTDIVGGLLISITLLKIFSLFIDKKKKINS